MEILINGRPWKEAAQAAAAAVKTGAARLRQEQQLHCAFCGADNDGANLYCHNCGQPLSRD